MCLSALYLDLRAHAVKFKIVPPRHRDLRIRRWSLRRGDLQQGAQLLRLGEPRQTTRLPDVTPPDPLLALFARAGQINLILIDLSRYLFRCSTPANFGCSLWNHQSTRLARATILVAQTLNWLNSNSIHTQHLTVNFLLIFLTYKMKLMKCITYFLYRGE